MTAKETQQLIEARKDIEYMQKDVQEIKETLKSLPEELIKALDDRYAKKEEVEEIKETITPFTTFRRRAWQFVIFSSLSIATVAIILWEIQRFRGK